MAKCLLTVQIDRPDATFAVGEQVTGVVIADIDEACQCRSLHIECGWETRGEGEASVGPRHSITVPGGDWRPGETIRVPFELTAPGGPLSYPGQRFSLVWLIRARADLAWAADPSAAVPFTLVARDPIDSYDFGPSHRPPQREPVSPPGPGAASLIGCTIGGLVTLGSAWLIWRSVWAEGVREGWWAPVAGVGAVVGLLLLGFGLYGVLAWRRRRSSFSVSVEPREVARGDRVTCIAHARAPATGATARLVFQERVVRPLDADDAVDLLLDAATAEHTTEIVVAEATLQPDPDSRGERLRAELTIPPGAPCSFAAGSTRLRWLVRVSTRRDRDGDVCPIVVQPRTRSRASPYRG
jgi:hypothetical protein